MSAHSVWLETYKPAREKYDAAIVAAGDDADAVTAARATYKAETAPARRIYQDARKAEGGTGEGGREGGTCGGEGGRVDRRWWCSSGLHTSGRAADRRRHNPHVAVNQ